MFKDYHQPKNIRDPEVSNKWIKLYMVIKSKKIGYLIGLVSGVLLIFLSQAITYKPAQIGSGDAASMALAHWSPWPLLIWIVGIFSILFFLIMGIIEIIKGQIKK